MVSVELLKVKNTLTQKVTAKNGHEKLKRSWKKSWKVLEFEELKRLRTLYHRNQFSKLQLYIFVSICRKVALEISSAF